MSLRIFGHFLRALSSLRLQGDNFSCKHDFIDTNVWCSTMSPWQFCLICKCPRRIRHTCGTITVSVTKDSLRAERSPCTFNDFLQVKQSSVSPSATLPNLSVPTVRVGTAMADASLMRICSICWFLFRLWTRFLCCVRAVADVSPLPQIGHLKANSKLFQFNEHLIKMSYSKGVSPLCSLSCASRDACFFSIFPQ